MTTNAQTLWEGWVPSVMIDETRERVEKVAKRATAKGFPRPTMEITQSELRPTGVNTKAAYEFVVISAPGTLRFEGWTLAGVIEVLGNDQPFIRQVPGVALADIPADLTVDPKRCDYCRKQRTRLETFIVRSDEGQWAVVGRDCLRDFLGHDPSALIAYARYLSHLTWGWDGSTTIPNVYDFKFIVGLTARIASKVGFLGKGKARENGGVPTVNRIFDFEDRTKIDRWSSETVADRANREFPLDEAAQKLIDDTIAGLSALADKADLNDWETSLSQLWDAGSIGQRYLGYAASAVVLGLRAQENRDREAARKVEQENRAPSVYLGKVGDRVRSIELAVTFTRTFDGDFGPSQLVKGRSGDSDILFWNRKEDVAVGDVLVLDATVKSQEIDRFTDEPCTTIFRPAIKSVTPVAE